MDATRKRVHDDTNDDEDEDLLLPPSLDVKTLKVERGPSSSSSSSSSSSATTSSSASSGDEASSEAEESAFDPCPPPEMPELPKPPEPPASAESAQAADASTAPAEDAAELSEGEIEDESDGENRAEVHKLLEQPLRRESQRPVNEGRTITKKVLKDRRNDVFDVLPSGWVEVMHRGGLPIYFNRQLSVVTASRPYLIGKRPLRTHPIPQAAIPCLDYRRALEEEQKEAEKKQKGQDTSQEQDLATEEKREKQVVEDIVENAMHQSSQMKSEEKMAMDETKSAVTASIANNSTAVPPKAKLEAVEDVQKRRMLKHQEVQSYCERLFQYETITKRNFRSFKDRRLYAKHRQAKRQEQLEQEALAKNDAEGDQDSDNDDEKQEGKVHKSSLPEGTKLISIPVVEFQKNNDNGDEDPMNQRVLHKSRKKWLLNPKGKSHVCILHEYLQHSIKIAPTYKFEDTLSPLTPYCATILINSITYGRGIGASKKLAKNEAARRTLEILIPDIKQLLKDSKHTSEDTVRKAQIHSTFFDDIRIDDPRVPELCNKTSEPSPYSILATCLQRNYGLGDNHIQMELTTGKGNRNLNVFRMKVNDHEVEVKCKNKRSGKQLAAQCLLKRLHPQIEFWGPLLRLYGSKAILSQKLKREKELEVTGLQTRTHNRPEPNIAILEKLRSEMLNLAKKKRTALPIGKFVQTHFPEQQT